MPRLSLRLPIRQAAFDVEAPSFARECPDLRETVSSMTETTGLVLRVDAKCCHVEVNERVHLLVPRGRLFEQRGVAKNPIAVGDSVVVSLQEDGSGSIDAVLPRHSKLARASAGEGKREQVLVANVDLVLVVSAIREPAFRPSLVDRILAGAERGGIDACVVINKIDREKANAQGAASVEYWRSFYANLGYQAIPTCATDGRGIDAIRELLHGKISVFSGLSGVGKSSLLNAVEPGLALRVGSVSKRGAREGRHTTTHSSLLRLECGGHVVDTPGIRNFGLFGVEVSELAGLFREFREHLGKCGFDDCSHDHEPDCAIRRATEDGTIRKSRYLSYKELLKDARGGRLQ